jgi:hypothetical protein
MPFGRAKVVDIAEKTGWRSHERGLCLLAGVEGAPLYTLWPLPPATARRLGLTPSAAATWLARCPAQEPQRALWQLRPRRSQ